MFVLADDDSKRLLEDKLEKLNLSVEVYQILESSFRQLMMKYSEDKYCFNRDEIVAEVFNESLSPEEKFNLLKDYILRWEQSNQGMKYGYECYEFDEVIQDAAIYEQLNQINSQMQDFANEYPKFLDSKQVKRWLGEVRNQTMARLSHSSKNYLSDLTDGESSKSIHNHGFFAKYIAFSYGVFGPIVGQRKLASWTGFKVKREFPKVPAIQNKMNAVFISDRMRNIERYKELEDTSRQNALMTSDFKKYLKEINRELNNRGGQVE